MTLKERVVEGWANFRRSILYIPVILAVSAILLFAVTTVVDSRIWNAIGREAPSFGNPLMDLLVFGGTANAATSVLAAIAGSWATIAGVVYSVTLVTLQLSATKYSAQVIPTFERDRLNQVVLGVFAATVVYSLLVLKTVRQGGPDSSQNSFVPLLGVNVAILLAVASLFLFIWFIGNLTSYIRPTKFVEGVTRNGIEALPVLREPKDVDGYENVEDGGADDAERRRSIPVTADIDGHASRIDWKAIRELIEERARDPDSPRVTRIAVAIAVGTSVSKGDVLFRLTGPGAEDEDLQDELRETIETSPLRDVHNDPLYAAESLGDIGVTALSAGSRDLGVAKSALRGLLRFARADLSKEAPPDRFALRVGDGRVYVEPSPERGHAVALKESKLVLDQAAAGGFWSLFEEFANDTRGLIVAAAENPDRGVWDDVLRWLAPIVSAALDLDDAASKARFLKSMGRAREALAKADHHAEAHELADLLSTASRGLRLEPRVAVALQDALGA